MRAELFWMRTSRTTKTRFDAYTIKFLADSSAMDCAVDELPCRSRPLMFELKRHRETGRLRWRRRRPAIYSSALKLMLMIFQSS